MPSREGLRAVKLRVVGIVQGVGFRPFVHRLAVRVGVAGYVKNLGGSEVEIHIEGPEVLVEEFMRRLELEKPPPAIIEELTVEETRPLGLGSFRIEKSAKSKSARSMIPPDFGICRWCAEEVLGQGTRFSGYPWNSCAWCGPRFSMMYTLPYDRENTSMKEYPLCPECLRDYEDLWNERRYHAQGISCPRCGPRTMLLDGEGRVVDVKDPVAEAARLIDEGMILAVKGLGGFHIASLATDDDVVARVRRIKSRPTQPLALMARDCGVASRIVVVGERECGILESPRRPILLLPKREDSPVSELIAPGLDTIGVMLPYTGLHLLLLSMVRDGFLVMTSGNRHGFPMCRTVPCILDQLGGEVDYILTHDRVIVHRVDDSVARFTGGNLVLLRRGRGYAPEWIRVKGRQLGEHVAVGAELQSAGAVSFEDKVVLTQYIGDIDEPGQLEELEEELRWFIKAYSLSPRSVALDMHPAYTSRRAAARLAEELGVPTVEVQHHHAHAVAAAVDAGLEPGEWVPAVTVDGAGYGLDGTVWGGEALLSSAMDFKRVASIRPFPLPGGDTATKRPPRILVGLLSMAMSEDEVIETLGRIGILDSGISEAEARLSYRVSRSRAPLTSSAGRLIDAVSSMLGVCHRRTYEGEPAMKLEAYAKMGGGEVLRVEPPEYNAGPVAVLDAPKVILWALEELESGAKPQNVAATIMYWIGWYLASRALEESDGSRALLLSGGAAVNDYIYRGALEAAREYGARVLLPSKTPPGDGGVALGQIVVASYQV